MRKYLSFMVDIETTGLQPNAVILTLGACAFDIDNGEVLSKFYVKLDRNQGIELGLSETASTLQWWQSAKVSDAARREALTPDPDTVAGYASGIKNFFDWVIGVRDTYPARETLMWGRDPDFDMVKIQQSAQAIGNMVEPWRYWEHKSCRTMDLIGAKLGINPRVVFKREGTHHNALDDALHQARVVSGIWQRIENPNTEQAPPG